MSQTLIDPQLANNSTGSGRWMVVIFNNDHNSVDEVMDVLVKATGCDLEEAAIETWEAHHFGKAPVHFASQEECDQVAGVISRIGVRAEVTKEWMD